MSTRPEARIEYSRGIWPVSRAFARSRERGGRRHLGVVAGGLLGAVLLIAAEFTTLYSLHVISSNSAVSSTLTGRHDSYALVPIAVAAAGLAMVAGGALGPGADPAAGAGRLVTAARAAVVALLGVGVCALILALLRDLPAVHANGLTRHYLLAATTAGPGLYLEILGGVLLTSSGIAGLLAWLRPRPAGANKGIRSRLMAAPEPWSVDSRRGAAGAPPPPQAWESDL